MRVHIRTIETPRTPRSQGGARGRAASGGASAPEPPRAPRYFYETICPKFDISQSPSCWFFFDKQYDQLAIKSLLTKYMLARMHTHPSEVTLPQSLMRPTAVTVTPSPSYARTRLDPADCTSSSRRLSPLARSTD